MATVATRQIQIGAQLGALAVASGGGDKFTPSDRTSVIVFNGSGSAVTVTVVTPNTGPGGTAIADFTFTVDAGEIDIRGPFPATDWAGAGGLADITWSAATAVAWAPVQT